MHKKCSTGSHTVMVPALSTSTSRSRDQVGDLKRHGRGDPKAEKCSSLQNTLLTASASLRAPAGMLLKLSPCHHFSLQQQVSSTFPTCSVCSLFVDRPVQTVCGKVVCCTCITEYTYKQRKNKEVETFPCCSGIHVTPPIPAAAVVTQVIGSLLLCCDTCKQAVALKEIRDHTNCGCTTGIVVAANS